MTEESIPTPDERAKRRQQWKPSQAWIDRMMKLEEEHGSPFAINPDAIKERRGSGPATCSPFRWVRWWTTEEDHRPLTYPPNERILGWWQTGEDHKGGKSICALVRAESPEEASEAIKKDWPEFRTFDIYQESNLELSDRFALEDWMRDRFSTNDQCAGTDASEKDQ